MTRILILFGLLLALPAGAADKAPTSVRLSGECNVFTMCNAQTGTGVCTTLPASGDEIVMYLATRSTLSFYSTQGVGAYSCDVYSNDTGYTATATAKQKLNATPLTTSASIVSFSGLFAHVWLECTATGTQAPVWAYVCPADR